MQDYWQNGGKISVYITETVVGSMVISAASGLVCGSCGVLLVTCTASAFIIFHGHSLSLVPMAVQFGECKAVW